jgi:hypothetical protein
LKKCMERDLVWMQVFVLPLPLRSEREKQQVTIRSEREGDNRLRVLRATRPHTVGYIGGYDQEQGEIE